MQQDVWAPKKAITIADFFIVGAMKSGTTTLHNMLHAHPDIFMAKDELFYFDMDDIAQHPDFIFQNKSGLQTTDVKHDEEGYWHWYQSQFSKAREGQLKGEDSTTYLCSELAIARIAKLKPDAKIVVMLRQPSLRAYSHYWHMVRAGRAGYSFEDTLRFQPQLLLQRSDYSTQLNMLYRYFPRQQVKVILFEHFIVEPEQILTEICQFLDVDEQKLPADSLHIHANKGQTPKFLKLHLLKCRLFRGAVSNMYNSHFTEAPKNRPLNIFERIYRLCNPMVNTPSKKITQSHKQLLDDYFSKVMPDINELTGLDAYQIWFGEREK
ncbi:sulfotransferase [Pseudoalteromonas sp. A25]|uniref:sulfotransferase family protein n=1 Tax=Pseudoalteromonas sp. A25 TaxID=116092 RepID=UPI001260630C|nr:sulfotransferase [Pseudoalteromonas sp. A25]BBN80387.1 sulfotransferase [Pseudoalteromonas sp. A25]